MGALQRARLLGACWVLAGLGVCWVFAGCLLGACWVFAGCLRVADWSGRSSASTTRAGTKKIVYTSRFVRVILAQGPC